MSTFSITSHVVSALPSPFDEAIVLTADGVGDKNDCSNWKRERIRN